jgi:hypothetical protein
LVGQSAAEVQPQFPPPAAARHCAPALPLHTEHIAPLAPHALVLVPATQVVPLQQPPLHADCVAPPQLALHVCVDESHACPVGQSAGALQPHAPDTHAWPIALAVQSTQLCIEPPHALAEVPPWHMPFAPQHAPMHGWLALHAVEHRCVVVLHAEPAGQSAVELQPHAPATHCEPMLLPAQSMHAAPLAPQPVAAVPVLQVPLAQQPPWQSAELEHAVEHRCVVALHACPVGQSPATMQPPTVRSAGTDRSGGVTGVAKSSTAERSSPPPPGGELEPPHAEMASSATPPSTRARRMESPSRTNNCIRNGCAPSLRDRGGYPRSRRDGGWRGPLLALAGV